MSSTQRIQKVDDTDGNVLIFGAHVANLLIQRSFQMIGQGQNQLVKPFVERFEGSLLFVDISGFTALSRRLHVESLKIHINAYFTLMLDVVDKHDGDVVKFAGDALFIIWPANSTNDLASCVQKALNCSLEITSVCDSYKINFDESGYASPSSSSPKDGSSIRRKQSAEKGVNDIFLNVHVGLSVGTMAAVDVGCSGRWEMLLIGQPLNDVAVAETHAMSGEVVVTGGAHAILTASGAFLPGRDQTGTMFCESRSDNCYVVWTDFVRFDSSMDDDDIFTTTAPRNRLDFVDGILREIYAGLSSPKPDFAAWKLEDFQTQGKVFTMILIKAHVHEAARSTAVVDLSPNTPPSQPRSNRSSQATQSCATEMEFEMAAARSFMEGEADNLFDRKRVSPPGSAANTSRKSYPGHMDSPSIFRDPIRRTSSPGGMNSPLLGDQRKTAVMDVNRMVMILTAELRKCTILFINIGIDVNLFMSPEGVEKKLTPSHVRRRPLGSLPFIARSSDEVKADEKLLAELQRCLEIMSTTLTENGGQIRQFIHDDKGTVCIGTIGLRGSTTEDNSAAAVETARSIISQLQAVGLNASIGIASGKAFCGLVGSSVRHEYAVMGPSVNLSARLMGAAAAGTILCDEKTKESDRRHKYVSKSAISAKGYDAPVSTYMPLTNVQGRSSTASTKTPKASKSLISPSSSSSSTSLNTAATASLSLTPISIPFQRNRSQETSSSEEESEVSADEQFIAKAEHGLCGRSEILKKLMSFVTLESTSTSLWADPSAEMKAPIPGIDSIPKSDFGVCFPLITPAPSKMKIAFISGPYGIGKSLVLKAVHHRSLLTPSVPGGLRFKYHAQTNRYNRTSLFYVWKKSMSHLLLMLRFQGARSLSREDLRYLSQGTHQLQPVPENSDFPSPSQSTPPAPGSNTARRKATIMHAAKILKGAKKQELIRSNIEHLMTLLEPSYRDLEPLVMNGFLCTRAKEHSDATKNLSCAERLKPTIKLLAAMLEKIAEVLGGSLLFIIDDVQSMDHASWGLLRHMWKNNTSVTVVCSIRTFGAQSVNYESEPAFSNPVDPKDGEISLENELASTFVEDQPTISEPAAAAGGESAGEGRDERVLVIELATLDEKAVGDLATRLLKEYCATFQSKEKMLNVVYRLSGGNPLYAVEVSKAAIKMVKKFNNLTCSPRMTPRDLAQSKFDRTTSSHGGSRFDDEIEVKAATVLQNPPDDIWEKTFQKLSSSLRSERIEEIIIFRFDQLNPKSQLLLRIAAVAGFDNAPFSARMLSYILPHFSSARTQDELFDRKTGGEDEEDDEDDYELCNSDEEEDTEDSGCKAIISALGKILRESEFLRICKSSSSQDMSDEGADGVSEANTDRSKTKSNTESSFELKTFEFTSSLIQASILNLNLRDQNSILHFQTASYLESQITPRISPTKSSTDLYLMSGKASNWSNSSFSTISTASRSPSSVTSATWYRMGIHWQHSGHYVKAMACFYNSAVLLESIGSSRDGLVHLFKAYDMLEILRAEAGFHSADNKDAFQMISKLSSCIGDNTRSQEIPLSLDPFPDLTHETEEQVDYSFLLSREDIYRMLRGDTLALDIAIKLLITLSQNIVVTLAQRKGRDTKYYSEALELTMATCKGFITLSSPYPTRRDSFSGEPLPVHEDLTLLKKVVLDPNLFDISDTAEVTMASRASKFKGDDDEHFYLKDFTSLFPILAGLTLRLLHGTKQDESMIQKVDMMTSTFLTLTREHGDSMHIIRALHLQSVFYSRVNRLRESLANCDEITDLYVFEDHSFQMSKVYGGDRGIGAMAAAAVGNVLIGRWSKALSLCETTARYLPRLTSISVVSLSTHSLAIAYGLMGMHDRAHSIFATLMRNEAMSNAFSVFRDLNPYYAELYAKRADLASARSKKENDMKMDLNREEERLKEKRRVREEMEREVARRQGPNSALASEAGLPLVMETWDLDGILGQTKTRPPKSFSSVVMDVMKGSQARNMMRRMITEKKEQKLKSDKANLLPQAAAATSPSASPLASPEKRQSAPSSPVRSSVISKPLEGTGTISFQLSLMTGRGMDSVKAELCMLNALTVMSGAQVTSHLEDSGQPLTAEEYCEEGLKCIANILVESTGTKISNYSHTCDQVHTLLVEAKLYGILERLSACNAPSYQRYDDAYRDSIHSNMISNDSEDCSLSFSASSPPSMSYSPSSTPSDTCFPTPGEYSTVLGRDRKYYAAKALETMKRCELLARTVNAPGVLFLTGLKMISMGIDAQAGREILAEAMETIDLEERNRLIDLEREIERKERQKEEDIRARAPSSDEREVSSDALSDQYLDVETSVVYTKPQQLIIEASEEVSCKSQDIFENLDCGEHLEYASESRYSSWSGITPKTKAFRKLVLACDSSDIPIVVDAKRALGG